MNDRTLDAVLLSEVTGNHSPRSAVQMIRSAGTALVGIAVLATLAGCVSQDPFGLPELTPVGASPTAQVYPGYGYGYGYGYPSGYRPGYGYGYADPYYAAQGPYPYAYGYGYGYNPYAYGYGYSPYPRYVVVPCADNNRDGRCDTRPPKDQGHQGGGYNDDSDRTDRPRRQRDARGVVPRVGSAESLGVVPAAQPRTAPVAQQPARVRPEPRHATPSDATAPRAPRVGRGRPSMTGDDVASSRPTQEP